jgi:hypothetical protein
MCPVRSVTYVSGRSDVCSEGRAQWRTKANGKSKAGAPLRDKSALQLNSFAMESLPRADDNR